MKLQIGLLTLGTYILLVAFYDIHAATAIAGMFLALVLSFVVPGRARAPRHPG
jgi:hypothetical protein